jgi:hypothetical protein
MEKIEINKKEIEDLKTIDISNLNIEIYQISNSNLCKTTIEILK